MPRASKTYKDCLWMLTGGDVISAAAEEKVTDLTTFTDDSCDAARGDDPI